MKWNKFISLYTDTDGSLIKNSKDGSYFRDLEILIREKFSFLFCMTWKVKIHL